MPYYHLLLIDIFQVNLSQIPLGFSDAGFTKEPLVRVFSPPVTQPAASQQWKNLITDHHGKSRNGFILSSSIARLLREMTLLPLMAVLLLDLIHDKAPEYSQTLS